MFFRGDDPAFDHLVRVLRGRTHALKSIKEIVSVSTVVTVLSNLYEEPHFKVICQATKVAQDFFKSVELTACRRFLQQRNFTWVCKQPAARNLIRRPILLFVMGFN
jgi:hypothetical protein